MSSRTASAIQRNPVSKNKTKKQTKNNNNKTLGVRVSRDWSKREKGRGRRKEDGQMNTPTLLHEVYWSFLWRR